MPVGFENSALKMSFSLSSLEPGGGQGSPQMVRLQAERPYNSLTKKSRTAEQEMWRHSWNTQEEKKDEFWAALQPNYNYLMDNNLIESCKEASGELSGDEEDITPLLNWSFKDFAAQFSELCSWLNSIREAVYGKEENIRDRNLRLEHVEVMHRKVYRRKLFTEQAERLLVEHSDLQDEVTWRLKYLNCKWDMLEQSISPSKSDANQESLSMDVEHEAQCLKEWIREMEGRLKPLNMHIVNDWVIQELAEKVTEYEVLHQDIRAHGKVVAAVLRRAELAEATASIRLAKRLERRWHLLFLRALEWQFHLENLLKRRSRHRSQHFSASDSDEEPVTKHPRLSGGEGSDNLTDEGSYFEDDIKDYCAMDARRRNASSASNSTTAVGSNTSEGCAGTDSSSGSERHELNGQKFSETMPSKSVVNRSAALEKQSSSVGLQAGSRVEEIIRPQQRPGNWGSFDFKHQDTDSEPESSHQKTNCRTVDVSERMSDIKTVDESSEDEWTWTAPEKTPDCTSAGAMPHNPARKSNVAVKLNFDGGVDRRTKLVANKRSAKYSGSENEKNKLQEHVKVSSTTRLSSSKESIQRLVTQAERLVREESISSVAVTSLPQSARRLLELPLSVEGTSSQTKQARIKRWVKMHTVATDSKCQLPDSCDASGEYTTGDSDEDCTLLQSPEEMNESFMMNKHFEALLTASPSVGSDEVSFDTDMTPIGKKTKCTSPLSPEEVPKVVLRTKRSQRERPWSVSGIPQASPTNSQRDYKLLAHLSTSESALYPMFLIPQVKDMTPGLQANVSSSTIDETTIAMNEGQACSTGSLRRRKARLRKRSLLPASRKSESGSDGVTPALSGSSDTQQVSSSSMTHRSSVDSNPKLVNDLKGSTLVKSQSFSGSVCSGKGGEASREPVQKSRSCQSSETEEKHSKRMHSTPVFRLGPEKGVVSMKPPCLAPPPLLHRSGDSDVDRSSAAPGTEEQLSSLSEQAWDNYQEKYMSEPYSEEIADSDAARRLLEFGDDYHKYLDSLSDCASSLEAGQKAPPLRRRKLNAAGDGSLLDSDSDLEDIHHLIEQSQKQFMLMKQVLSKQLLKGTLERRSSDYAEVVATCKENKRVLKVILENVKGDLSENCKDISVLSLGLFEKWSDLETHAEELKRVSELQQELVSMRKELLDLSNKIASLVSNIHDRSDLEYKIQMVKSELSLLLERKEQLLQLNVAVHQLVTEPQAPNANIVPSPQQLKNIVTELYQIWSDTFTSVSAQMKRLERAVDTWRVFDTQLSNLQTALQDDHKTLALLQTALEGGTEEVNSVASSVRDVARVLTEVSVVRRKTDLPDSEGTLVDAGTVPEGSLSDSGISDSGSEQELSERAKRLAALRRLARHLRTELVPAGATLSEVDNHIELLDGKLRQLQDVCHDLVVRTARSVDSSNFEESEKDAAHIVPDLGPPKSYAASTATKEKRMKENKDQSNNRTQNMKQSTSAVKKGGVNGSGITEKNSKRRPWFWRVFCTALPFQLALVVILCMVYFMEPHCCDGVNNLNLSLTPQLRYVRGPPPV